MKWNWQLPEWPQFESGHAKIAALEKQFLMGVGSAVAYLKGLEESDYSHFIVDMLSTEGLESARIEGELLDRQSLQSSIKHHFGLDPKQKPRSEKEAAMAKLLFKSYATYEQPLTHEMLCQWHEMLFTGDSSINDCGKYRTHREPMQIVSNKYNRPQVFFEAPPSSQVHEEMERFIEWFNQPLDGGSLLAKAAIAHVYFESIHPFEDGNGRIGRALVEKMLSQGAERPILIAVSSILEKRRKEYYEQLGRCNHSLDANDWVQFFAAVVVQAQEEAMGLLGFLIEKTKMFDALEGQLNQRQEKVLLRLFAAGPKGFAGGLSAENYMKITKAARATATRDLANLVDKGALRKTGERKSTRYWLNIPTVC